MPVIATATQSQMLTRDDVRMWLRDFPPGLVPKTGVINSLLDDVEFSDDDIGLGIRMAVDRYNATTPITRITEDQIPRAIVMYGAVAHLLAGEAHRQRRNQATSSAEGVVPVGIDDKVGPYSQAAEALMAQFDVLAGRVKVQRNMESVYGGFGSGYQWVSTARYG